MHVELAVTDGMPPPADLPCGEFRCTMVDGGACIDRADSRILISHELLHQITGNPGWASIDWGSRVQMDLDGRTVYEDALLKIHGVNRQVVYRIIEYVPRVHAYIAEWPD